MKYVGVAIMVALLLATGVFFLATQRVDASARAANKSARMRGDSEKPDVPKFPEVFMSDVVVSNTDPDLKNTDTFLNAEPGIAIDPNDSRRIVISSFSGSWSKLENDQFQNAPIWYSQNRGKLWTKEFTIPAPPGVNSGLVQTSPCDETFGFDRNGILYGAFLLDGVPEGGASCSLESEVADADVNTVGNVYSGATSDPTDPNSWQWLVVDGKTKPTNHHVADQPWLVVNKNPSQLQQDNVYVAYQSRATMQVAVSDAQSPPDFLLDTAPGPANAFGFNSAHRLAADRKSGAIYSLWQVKADLQCLPASPVTYMLNRSLDGGHTWGLNGNASGIAVAEACSHQDVFTYRFGEIAPNTIDGGVNPLRGGIDALGVDPKTGDVYVAFGEFDQAVNRDRIGIVQVSNESNGEMVLGTPHFVSGPEHQSALPAVAVTDNGVVGVLYDTADHLNAEGNLPYFSVHLAISQDHGISFQDVVLQTYLFPGKPVFNTGPRPLGDFQQMKSMGRNFYGVFSGDGGPFGRPFHKIDPIFFESGAP